MNNLFLIGALGVGAYLFFREQIDAALSGETPTASSPPSAPSGGVPKISPTTGQAEYPPFNTPTLPTVTPPVNVPSNVTRSAAPAWLVGFWDWSGGNRRLIFNAEGYISLVNQGVVSYGHYGNGLLLVDGNVSTVTQTTGGMQTVNQTTGEVSNYSRHIPATTTPPVPVITIPPPVVPSPYPQMPNPVPQIPTGGGGYPTGGCLRAPCEPEIFI